MFTLAQRYIVGFIVNFVGIIVVSYAIKLKVIFIGILGVVSFIVGAYLIIDTMIDACKE